MSFFENLLKMKGAAIVGGIVGNFILPGIGGVIGAKLCMLAAADGNPLALLGGDVLNPTNLGSALDATSLSDAASGLPDPGTLSTDFSSAAGTAGVDADLNVYGAPATDIQGNVNHTVQGNPTNTNIHGQKPSDVWGRPSK